MWPVFYSAVYLPVRRQMLETFLKQFFWFVLKQEGENIFDQE